MKLNEAYPICKKSINIPFKDLFSDFSTEEIRINKGKAGQLMEKLCGLELSNTTKDFEDGELKTSELKESTAITMITDWVDDIIHDNPIKFSQSRLSKKIEHMIFMPLEKPSIDPLEWFFKDCVYIQITEGNQLYKEIKKDFEMICKLANEQVYKKQITRSHLYKTSAGEYGDGFLHTTSGKFIQIRTKDAGGNKSKPIYSERLSRDVTKVSRMAFYFLSSFKKHIDKNLS